MKTRLPLHQIAAFEAAATHLSFTKAAQEMNVQQPAISRQIAMLEAELGVALFRRTKPRLTLTLEGRDLFENISSGFDGIRNAMKKLQSGDRRSVLVVNAAIGFTSLFLMPRLAEFQALHPEIRVQIVTRDQDPDVDPESCDVVINFGDQGLPGMSGAPVFYEELTPVCKPEFLEGGSPVEPQALLSYPLLHMSSTGHIDDWERYFSGTGINANTPSETDRIYSYMVYLRAIEDGNGIGLGWRRLIEGMLESKALALACERTIRTHRAYHCGITLRARGREDAYAFMNWITTLVE